MKRIAIVRFGVAQDFQLDLVEQIVLETNPFQIEGDIGLDTGIGEAFGDTFTIAPIRDLLSDLRKVVLVIRVLDVGQKLRALSHQVHPPSQRISSRAHAFWIDISLGNHSATQKGRALMSVGLVVLGLAAMDRLHVERVSQNEGDPFSSVKIGDPVPGEDAFYGDNRVLATRRDRFEK